MQLNSSLISVHSELKKSLSDAKREIKKFSKVSDTSVLAVKNSVRFFADALCMNPDAAKELRRRATLIATLTAQDSSYLIAKDEGVCALQGFKNTEFSRYWTHEKSHKGPWDQLAPLRLEYDKLERLIKDDDKQLKKNKNIPLEVRGLLEEWRDAAGNVISECERTSADGCYWMVNHKHITNMMLPTYIEAIKRAVNAMVAWCREQSAPTAKQKGPWSKSDTPGRWAKKFGFTARTFVRKVTAGTIRAKKLSDKSYQVHLDDLPTDQK